MQMRITNLIYEYYDIVYNVPFPINGLEKLSETFYLSLYTIYDFILCMRQEPNPLVVSPATLKYNIGEQTDHIHE